MISVRKICVIGPSGCGKTAWIKRLHSGHFIEKYTPTKGAQVTSISLNTNHGRIEFECWEFSDKYTTDMYQKNTDGAIIFYDYEHTALNRYKEYKKLNPDSPVVFVRSFYDVEKVSKNEYNRIYHMIKPLNVKFYDVSAKTNYNNEKPFTQFARSFFGFDDTHFIEW